MNKLILVILFNFILAINSMAGAHFSQGIEQEVEIVTETEVLKNDSFQKLTPLKDQIKYIGLNVLFPNEPKILYSQFVSGRESLGSSQKSYFTFHKTGPPIFSIIQVI